ncbi:MAG: glycosyltransferase family 4 protein [Gammaproteobacteria bacterium]|jgi:glycosyltransferase involved in cell wall biosynthesis
MAEQPLTVLQLVPALETGGVERGTLELGAGLVKAGHRSLVVSGGGQLVSRLTGQGSEHIEWPIDRKSLWTLRLVGRLRRLLRERRIDILHARSRLPAWIAWRAWRRMPPQDRPHFVTTVHGLYSVSRYSSVMTRGEAVIAVSRAARSYILDNYPQTDAERVRVIERGIDPQVYSYGYRPPDSWLDRWYQEHPYLLERQVLTLPGRITRRKGHLDFLQLLASLVKAGLPVHGLIVGAEDNAHPGYIRDLHRAVSTLDIESYVTFKGHRMDMRDIYAVSNLVFSLSAKPESFGRTAREALSMGVPVVGYDHGGVGETLARAYPQGRVAPCDVSALERVTRLLLEFPVEVDQCRFTTVQEMIDQTLALYGELAGS